eukprot:scaffold17573_cov51-Phaeocystis_antarctica.AAC.2
MLQSLAQQLALHEHGLYGALGLALTLTLALALTLPLPLPLPLPLILTLTLTTRRCGEAVRAAEARLQQAQQAAARA